jgi:hypothetical protein
MLGIHMLWTVKPLDRQPKVSQSNFQTTYPTWAEAYEYVEVIYSRKIMGGEWDLKKCLQTFLERSQTVSNSTLFWPL